MDIDVFPLKISFMESESGRLVISLSLKQCKSWYAISVIPISFRSIFSVIFLCLKGTTMHPAYLWLVYPIMNGVFSLSCKYIYDWSPLE